MDGARGGRDQCGGHGGRRDAVRFHLDFGGAWRGARRPSLLLVCCGAADGQRVGGHIFGDAGACADIRAVADGDGRDQRGIAAHKDALADARDVLVHAVVVAGDGAGADIGSFADLRVAEVGEMVGLCALAEPRLFGLDKVAHVRVFADFASGAQVGKGADLRAIGDGGILEDAALADENAVAQGAVLDHREGADAAAAADRAFCRATAQRAR